MLLTILSPVCTWAHGFAGQRFFPTTFQVDDPFVSDEFSVLINRVKQSGSEPNRLTLFDIDYAKRVAPTLGLEFHEAYIHLGSKADGSVNGWDNLGMGAKWQFLTDEKRELILSLGTDIDVGGTGAHRVAESFSVISPAIFFGKGLGDLPYSVNFLRPVAVTGAVGLNFPTRSKNVTVDPDTGETTIERNPTTLTWALSVQYSLMYLQSFVKDIGLGNPFKRMIIVTEFPMETCLSADCRGQTTGTVNTGMVWCGKYMELGIAVQIPINSRSGRSAGVLGLIHLFMDDLFPGSLGRPIFH